MGEIDHKAKFFGRIKPALWHYDIFQALTARRPCPRYPIYKFALPNYPIFSESHLNVLDVTLHLVDVFIRRNVYSKPTDSYLYLSPPPSFSSSHSKHVFKAIQSFKHSLIPAYRRSKNLKEILATRNTQNSNSLEEGCHKCESRCDLCNCKNDFVESRNFCSFRTGKSILLDPIWH